MKKVVRAVTVGTHSIKRGFTIVEILVVVSLLAILATISVIIYSGIRWKSIDMLVQNTTSDAQKALQVYGTFNNKAYPSNIAGTDYAPPLEVALALYANADQLPVCHDLNSDQNAQLFLNTCNGFMPVTVGEGVYSSSCSYAVQNLHIKRIVSSNVVLQGPTIEQAEFSLRCESACDIAVSSVVSTFLSQGGIFPVIVPSRGSTLPQPELFSTGRATVYCVGARSPIFSDIIYHAMQNAANPAQGLCPTGLGLHYP